jgi:glutamyl-tRNA reductase
MNARQGEAKAAEVIVEAELAEFEAWSRGRLAAPAVVALRARTRAVLVLELERTLAGRLKHLGEADRAALAQMIDSATNKLLHVPTTRLREGADSLEGADLVRAVTHLFDLPDAPRVEGGGHEAATEDESDEAGAGPSGLPH